MSSPVQYERVLNIRGETTTESLAKLMSKLEIDKQYRGRKEETISFYRLLASLTLTDRYCLSKPVFSISIFHSLFFSFLETS